MVRGKDGELKLPSRQLAILAVARFAEPLAYSSVFPYLPEMIRDFGIKQKRVAFWAGITSASFSAFQSVTAVAWGRAADHFGRKPVLIFGLITTMICFVVWGMSTSLAMAITIRAIQGGSNGNVGIIRTMVAEMVPERELQPRAFSIMPLVWSLGSVAGPAFGGFFAHPARHYPNLFGKIEYFKNFPYALPNLIAMVFFLISATCAFLFLHETLAAKRERQDWGLLVGKRLSRVFKRTTNGKRHQAQRRRSFVDGEATAPLVPSNDVPKGASSLSASSSQKNKVFTFQTVANLLAYSILAFHSVAYDQNLTVFMDYEVKERTPENTKLPFRFDGGFGMESKQIGTIFTIYGITSCIIQFLLYPALVSRYGILKCYRCCSLIMPLVYFLTPYASLLPTERGRFIAVVSVMLVKAVVNIIAFPSVTILLTNSCTSLQVLGTLNGYATMFSGLGRALGPAGTGLVFSWGVKRGYVVSAYFFLGMIAVIGVIPVFLIVEGDGPTASPDHSDSEDDSDTHGMADSGVVMADEVAVDDESDDESDELAPLLHSDDHPRRYSGIRPGPK